MSKPVVIAIICLGAIQALAETNTGSRIGGTISSDAEVRMGGKTNRSHVGMGVGQGGTNTTASFTNENMRGTIGMSITNSSGMSGTNNPSSGSPGPASSAPSTTTGSTSPNRY